MAVTENKEFFLKGIYPIKVLSETKDGLVKVRAKTTFLHTSASQTEIAKFESRNTEGLD